MPKDPEVFTTEGPEDAVLREKSADEQVALDRERAGVTRELYHAMGLSKHEREEMGDDFIKKVIDEESATPELRAKLMRLLEDERRIENLAESTEGADTASLREFRQGELRVAMKEARRIDREHDVLDKTLWYLSTGNYGSGMSEAQKKVGERIATLNEEVARYHEAHDEEIRSAIAELANQEKEGEVVSPFEKDNQALRVLREFEKRRTFLLKQEAGIAQMVSGTERTRTNSVDVPQAREAHMRKAELEEQKAELLTSSPEAYLGIRLQELKGYRRALEKGRIVETPYVKAKIDEIIGHTWAGVPVFIHGHYGTGKTELAIHTARHYLSSDAEMEAKAKFVAKRPEPELGMFKDEESFASAHARWEEDLAPVLETAREPVVFRCAKDVTLEELFGHLSLVQRGATPIDEFVHSLDATAEKYFAEHPDIQEKDMDYYRELIREYALHSEERATTTDFALGPVYRAMKERRTLILDEVNALPHATSISLNHILTRKPGDRIAVQQDGHPDITMRRGFSIIATGNLGPKYERFKMDVAMMSRLHPMEYDYLPQYYATGTDSSLLEEHRGEGNELYHVMLASLMDEKGNIRAPEGTMENVWKFAMATKVLQDVFSRKHEAMRSHTYADEGGAAKEYYLQDFVPSFRSVERVLALWRADHFRHNIDHYLYQELVGEITNPKDRVYVYQIYEREGFFAGWTHSPYVDIDRAESFTITPPAGAPTPEMHFYAPKETIESAYGPVPPRKRWPVKAEEGMSIEERRELLERIEEEMLEITNLANDRKAFVGRLARAFAKDKTRSDMVADVQKASDQALELIADVRTRLKEYIGEESGVRVIPKWAVGDAKAMLADLKKARDVLESQKNP